MAQQQPPNVAHYGVFKVQRLIENTHMSQTWLALQKEPGKSRDVRQVVIKVALRDRTDGTEQFRTNQGAITNEEIWLQKLQGQEPHAAIVQMVPIVYTAGRPVYSAKTQDPGEPWFIVLDYLPGGSLRELMRAQMNLGVHLAVRVVYHIAQALAYAHQNGCVHLDIKPDNIMFRAKVDPKRPTQSVQPVLIDFGIARSIGEQHHIGGANAWLSPEAVRAKEHRTRILIQPELDIYPLGLVLHSMITGIHPRDEQLLEGKPLTPITQEMVRADSSIPARRAEEFAARLTDLIARMADPAAHKRPNTLAVVRELEDLMHLSVAEKAPQRRSWSMNFVLAATAAALIMLIVFWSLNGRAGTPATGGEPIAEAAAEGAASAIGSDPLPIDTPPTDEAVIIEEPAVADPQDTATPTMSVSPSSTPAEAVAGADDMPQGTEAQESENGPLPPTDQSAAIEAATDDGAGTDSSETEQSSSVPTDLTAEIPTATPTATPTAAPLEIPLVVVDTPTVTAPPPTLLQPTSTPIILSPTAPPAQPPTATRIATATPSPTVTPTPIRPTPVTTQAVQPTQPAVQPTTAPRTVSLLRPANGSALSGSVEFAWNAPFALAAEEGFEVAIWPIDQAQAVAYGLHNAGNFQSLAINLDKYSENSPGKLLQGQQYYWAVRIWRSGRSTWVSESRLFTYSGSN